MGKHTQGPWINGGEGRSIGRNEEMTFIFAATQENVTKKEQRANVRLACAAPDLLAALENLVASIENVDFSSHAGVYDQIPWAQAEQAIAKATGGGE